MAAKLFNLRLTDDLRRSVEVAAERDGLTPSEWVRRAIDRELDWAAATPPTKAPAKALKEVCRHPVNRRIGKGCGLCGKDPV